MRIKKEKKDKNNDSQIIRGMPKIEDDPFFHLNPSAIAVRYFPGLSTNELLNSDVAKLLTDLGEISRDEINHDFKLIRNYLTSLNQREIFHISSCIDRYSWPRVNIRGLAERISLEAAHNMSYLMYKTAKNICDETPENRIKFYQFKDARQIFIEHKISELYRDREKVSEFISIFAGDNEKIRKKLNKCALNLLTEKENQIVHARLEEIFADEYKEFRESLYDKNQEILLKNSFLYHPGKDGCALGFEEISDRVKRLELNQVLKRRPVYDVLGNYLRTKYWTEEGYFSPNIRLSQPIEELTEILSEIFESEENVLNLGGGREKYGVDSINVDSSEDAETDIYLDLNISGECQKKITSKKMPEKPHPLLDKNIKEGLQIKSNSCGGAYAIELIHYLDYSALSKDMFRILQPGKKYVVGHQGGAGKEEFTSLEWNDGITVFEIGEHHLLSFQNLVDVEKAHILTEQSMKDAGFSNVHTKFLTIINSSGPYFLTIGEKPN